MKYPARIFCNPFSRGSALENKRYSRQSILPQIGNVGQEKIQSLRVLVLGCGALGSGCAELLARAGVGFLRIVDRDVVELSNLQRQHLFDETDVIECRPKARAAAERLRKINSSITIEEKILDIHAGNIESLLENIDAVIDGMDRLEMRYLLNDACVKKNVPWFYGAVQGISSVWMTVVPHKGPCLRCVFPEAPAPGSLPTCDMSGVLGAAVSVSAAMEVTQLLRYFVGDITEATPNFVLTKMNLWTGEMTRIPVVRDEDCPCCGRGFFSFLDGPRDLVNPLCGHGAIQISPSRERFLNLPDLAKRIDSMADSVTLREDLLEIKKGELRILLFPSGRAIVYGERDPLRAKIWVEKYVG